MALTISRDLRGRGDLAGEELEAQVDHLGAVVDRVADAPRDRGLVALAAGVEHPDRHDRGAVGQAGEAEPVVGRLRDDPGHERAVAVAVQRVAVAGDEVVRARRSGCRRSRAIGGTASSCDRRRRCRGRRPRRPGRRGGGRRAGCAHASGALTPEPGSMFHCICSQPWAHVARARVVGVEGSGRVGDVVGHRRRRRRAGGAAARSRRRRSRRARRCRTPAARRGAPRLRERPPSWAIAPVAVGTAPAR